LRPGTPPPAPPSTPPPAATAATEGSPFCSSLPSAGAEFVNVDGEVALIVVRAAGGNCRFTYGAPGMTGGPGQQLEGNWWVSLFFGEG